MHLAGTAYLLLQQLQRGTAARPAHPVTRHRVHGVGRSAVDLFERRNGGFRLGHGVTTVAQLEIQLAQFRGQALELAPVHIRQRRAFLLQAFAALLQLGQHLRAWPRR